jgi:predicted phosphodiesterase
MLMAAIGRIYGNLPALDAVLGAIDQAGIQTVVHTGDCVVGHPWPNEVLDRLCERGIPGVQGDTDRWAARCLRKKGTLQRQLGADMFAAVERTFAALRSENIERLLDLPPSFTFRIDGVDVCISSGAPGRRAEALRAADDFAKFRRIRESTGAGVAVCGGPHGSFSRLVDDALFVNPGGVGAHGEASYALIDAEEEPWRAEIVSVEYDLEEVTRAVAESGWPTALPDR